MWAIQQDHLNPDLLVLAAEFGLYTSINGGANWHRLEGGVPTISFRDLKLQRRDDDVVGATFGRGFYVLDDYGPLRELADGLADGVTDAGAGTLFGVRDAWWYIPMVPSQALGRPTHGSTAYVGENPPFGAVFTYWMADTPETSRDARQAEEAELAERGSDVPFPGYDRLRAEALEQGPKVLLQVMDASGETVRWVEGPARAGVHRVSWDLRRPAPDAISLSTPGFVPPWASDPRGPLVAPGSYSVRMHLVTAHGVEPVGSQEDFEVVPVPTLLPGTDPVLVADFQFRGSELMRRIGGMGTVMGDVQNRLRHMRAALVQTPGADPALYGRMDAVAETLAAIQMELWGDPARSRLSQSSAPGVSGRVGRVIGGHWDTRQMPTATMRRNLEIAEGDLGGLEERLSALVDGELMAVEEALAAAGAPWTPGRRIGG